MSFHDCALLKERSFGAVRTTGPAVTHEVIGTFVAKFGSYHIFCADPRSYMADVPRETNNSVESSLEVRKTVTMQKTSLYAHY